MAKKQLVKNQSKKSLNQKKLVKKSNQKVNPIKTKTTLNYQKKYLALRKEYDSLHQKQKIERIKTFKDLCFCFSKIMMNRVHVKKYEIKKTWIHKHIYVKVTTEEQMYIGKGKYSNTFKVTIDNFEDFSFYKLIRV